MTDHHQTLPLPLFQEMGEAVSPPYAKGRNTKLRKKEKPDGGGHGRLTISVDADTERVGEMAIHLSQRERENSEVAGSPTGGVHHWSFVLESWGGGSNRSDVP